MAHHSPAGPVETGAPMDYAEHEKTYHLFLGLAKYGALHVAALLIAMAFAFFTSAGFFSALILFIIISLIGIYLLRRAPEHVA
ncbi:MAG: cytochrome C oxidase subunit IV [Rhizobiales bacterium 65-79]|nr:aa3-type cytochrome c oxidase subunit IV [Hyphomicrobiales bacterium]OJU06251.1 MAG: cytochrome C oxidase subunit IV [Rhizobiales bacterium 65-79]